MHALFHGLPPELCAFFEHCRSLSFEDKPDYDHFCNLFDSLLAKEGFSGDVEFNWDLADAKILGQDSRTTSDTQHEPNPLCKRHMG